MHDMLRSRVAWRNCAQSGSSRTGIFETIAPFLNQVTAPSATAYKGGSDGEEGQQEEIGGSPEGGRQEEIKGSRQGGEQQEEGSFQGGEQEEDQGSEQQEEIRNAGQAGGWQEEIGDPL